MPTAFLAPGTPTLWAAVAVVGLFLAVWVASVVLDDVSIVDTFWGLSFALVAVVVAVTTSAAGDVRWVLVAMTVLWGGRLGGFLLARFLRHDSEDPRYAEIRERHEGHFAAYSLVVIFGTQAVLVLVVSLPVQIAALSGDGVGPAIVPGLVVWAAGLVVEAVGDEQQRRFSKQDHDDDAVLDSGLWRYSRHPNKFGDFCAWWGIWLVALSAGGTWWTAVGPLVMSAILVRGTGKGEDAEGDSAHAAWVRRTSGFVPLPPKRTSS